MNFVRQEFLDDFCIVTLNKPEVKNAFDPFMIQEITKTFLDLNTNQEIKGIVLKGEGTAFCSGADLAWMKNMVNYTYEENIKDSNNLWNMFDAIKNVQHPVIAKVHGAVFGGALGILACCDYVVAEEKTKFCFSEVRLGLAPAVISSFILRKCADTFVRPYMLSAEVFSTTAAEKMGLVHQIFSNQIEIKDLIQKLSANGTDGMRETKKLLNRLEASHLNEHQKITTDVISRLRVSSEAQKRLQKFLGD